MRNTEPGPEVEKTQFAQSVMQCAKRTSREKPLRQSAYQRGLGGATSDALGITQRTVGVQYVMQCAHVDHGSDAYSAHEWVKGSEVK